MADQLPAITTWLLAGGEGRRMKGQDKGLLLWQGQPLATHVLSSLAPESHALGVVANRNLDAYQQLLNDCCNQHHRTNLGCITDNADWPPFSGPVAGLLTALPHTPTEWAAFCPCDTPILPSNLLSDLLQAAIREDAKVVVPYTIDPDGTARHHWVCAVLHKSAFPQMLDAFVKGERKVRQIIASGRIASVCYSSQGLFANFNTLETLNGGD